MGNTVASEGEDMAESPRVIKGEISEKKKKHRSFRKKLVDKFMLIKKDSTTPEKNFGDEKDQIMDKPKETSEATNRRRNYYKNLGIGQKGSMENDRVVKGLAKMNSGESKQPEAEKFDKESNKSFTSIAISKGKAMANVGADDSPYLKKNISDKDNDGLEGENMSREAAQLSIEDIAEMETPISCIDSEGNAISSSMAETKADETDALEENKIDESALETEKVESSYQNKEVEGFKLDFITRVQPKSMEQMRRKFLSKLTQEKIWLTPSEKPKSHQT
jgi:hypothetical protein